jgi:hypothetical protein
MSLYGGAKAAVRCMHGPKLDSGHQGVGRTFNILSPGGGLMEAGDPMMTIVPPLRSIEGPMTLIKIRSSSRTPLQRGGFRLAQWDG